MKIFTFFTPAEMTGYDLESETVIVIDVLRGTTTITAALKAGALKVIPVTEIDKGIMLADEMGHDNVILGGNYNHQDVDGFDKANSPLEYTLDSVQRKTLIYCSNSMGEAINACRKARRIICACFNNLQAVLTAAKSLSTINILCAGRNGRFSLEDTVLAGMIIHHLTGEIDTDTGLNDSSSTARYLYYRHHRNILDTLKQSAQGQHLEKIGFSNDIEYAAALNTSNILPELSLDKTHIIPTVNLKSMLPGH
ncbi:MAG: hypothetical protein GY839_05195 [candidate division Zixibacteria bacterium]|nr:hypothetical protein [candidate division Zixibacteria bacterium]